MWPRKVVYPDGYLVRTDVDSPCEADSEISIAAPCMMHDVVMHKNQSRAAMRPTTGN